MYFGESLGTALALILSLDSEVVRTVWTSLYVSACAIVIASFLGIPGGLVIGLRRFRGRRLVLTGLNTLMALPTVVVGLVVFGLLSRQGPLSHLGLLFTPAAMMLGGNIRGTTRTMTTAIALETSKGEFAFAPALGVVLLTVALVVNLLINFWQQR